MKKYPIFLNLKNSTNQSQIVDLMSLIGQYKSGPSVEVGRKNGNSHLSHDENYRATVNDTIKNPITIEGLFMVSPPSVTGRDITVVMDSKEWSEKTTKGHVTFKFPFKTGDRNSIRLELSPNEELQLQLFAQMKNPLKKKINFL